MCAALVFVFSACAAPAATPTKAPTSAPTTAPTTAPTATAAPTGTPSVTATPAATATLATSPTPNSTLANGMTGTLNVLEWSGYEDPLYWADFQKANPDAVVNFSFGTTDADVYGKMKAGDQSDLFHAYTGWLQFYVDDGLAQPIDTSRLSNWDKVPDSFKQVGQINGQQYFLPWDWGFTSVLYRSDKVPEGVDSWDALLNQAYKGHVSMWNDGPGAVTVSAYIHDYDETAITDVQLAAIKQEWIDQKPLNYNYWDSDQTQLIPWMKDGSVWVAYAWQGAYATLLNDGVPVVYSNPKEGRNSWVGVYGINKNTANLDLAYAFLDAKLGELTGTNLVNNFYYGTTNQDVMNAITDETLKEAFSINDPSILKTTNFTPNLTAQQRTDWTQMWADVQASQ
jgi:spermidine/putrescine transport system substrate-binding protein